MVDGGLFYSLCYYKTLFKLRMLRTVVGKLRCVVSAAVDYFNAQGTNNHSPSVSLRWQ
jgi:hypothetical protein